MQNSPNYRFSVAPMMDWTDRHCRVFHRRIWRTARLYTEMVTADAVIHGDRARLLGFDPVEHPVALQLGGADPVRLAEAARIGADLGYDEINLNVGCPSDRVQSGRFGACLMAEPSLVAACVAAMRAAVAVPVTVKTRIGIDSMEGLAPLAAFVDAVSAAGCDTFVVHARNAWLQGLSPKENREVPPLRYEIVHALKQERPDLTIVINGGIAGLAVAESQLDAVDGVMIGRAAYRTPYLFAGADRRLCDPGAAIPGRREIVEGMMPYLDRLCAAGEAPSRLTRHMLGLYHGAPRARLWRRLLGEEARKTRDGPALLRQALDAVDGASADRPADRPADREAA